jgi:hypothetical protein
MFNSFNYGGFVAGLLYPNIRIYIDGRLGLYSQEVIEDYYRPFVDPKIWPEFSQKYGIDLTMLEMHSASGIHQILENSPEWQQICQDPLVKVFQKTQSR